MNPLSLIRRALVGVRDAIDRRLHPFRGRKARARLGQRRPDSVLFVCLGNICRSPYAAHALRSRPGAALRVDSAGFILPGRQPPENALTAAMKRGVSTEAHRSQTVSNEVLSSADVVFIFDRFNARRLRTETTVQEHRVFWLGDFDPEWSGKRAIIDPWGKTLDEFDRTFARIDRCLDEVVSVIATQGPETTTDGTP